MCLIHVEALFKSVRHFFCTQSSILLHQSRPSTSLPTPRSPEIHAQALSASRPRAVPPLQPPSSPSPPPAKTLARSRPRSHHQNEPLGNATPNYNFNSYSTSPSADNSSPLSRLPMQSVIGAKRRHAVMLETPITPLSSGVWITRWSSVLEALRLMKASTVLQMLLHRVADEFAINGVVRQPLIQVGRTD